MFTTKDFAETLFKNKIEFFTGIPDSLFKDLCWYFEKKHKKKNFITSNEGSSIGLGIGYYLSTKKIPLIYLQNSGLGNAINPLVSMADEKVYSIPLFLLIGWRGEILKKKQLKDEPQHKKQGLITEDLLKLLGIKYRIIDNKSNYKKIIKYLKSYAQKKSKPVALLIRKNVFKNDKIIKKFNQNLLNREEALKIVIENIPSNAIKISTTGMLSRELNEINSIKKNAYNTFMCVGGMGHAISIASGIALSKNKKKIYCLDGDGSFLMHLGASTTSAKLNNIIHIVFNNKSHDSVGGHETCAPKLKLKKIAKDLGYKNCRLARSSKEIKKILKKSMSIKKNLFLEIVCKQGNRKNLTRPKGNLINYKEKFIKII